MPSRDDILRSLFSAEGCGLEIGPSYNPLIPKASGYNVETVDYTNKDGLIKKYMQARDVDISRIEEVDYVTGGRSMLEGIQHRRYYDYIVASHVIEHQPDLLGFLNECAELLKETGTLVLAVPDKRWCFDLLQPVSTTGAVLQAHLERRERPQPGAAFDSVAYDVLRGGQIGWGVDCTQIPTFNATLQKAKEIFDHAVINGNYIDVHVWRFVPSSFRLLIEDLSAIGASSLRERQFVLGVGHEFYVALSNAGRGPGKTRIDLALDAMREVAAIPLGEATSLIHSSP